MGVQAPSAGPELAQSGGIVDALQQQMQQHQLEYDTAAGNLALQGQQQQLQFQAQQEEYSLQRQKVVDSQSDAITREQYKQLKNKGKTGGFFGSVLDFAAKAVGIYSAAEGAGIAPIPFPQNRSNQVAQPYRATPPFYPTPTGRYPGS
jgi:hypothetical protein